MGLLDVGMGDRCTARIATATITVLAKLVVGREGQLSAAFAFGAVALNCRPLCTSESLTGSLPFFDLLSAPPKLREGTGIAITSSESSVARGQRSIEACLAITLKCKPCAVSRQCRLPKQSKLGPLVRGNLRETQRSVTRTYIAMLTRIKLQGESAAC